MAELWYEAELKRPPLITVNVTDVKFVEHLQQAITAFMCNHREEDAEFGKTAALLSRLIARRKNSFHRQAGFRKLLKLNSMACRLLRVDMPREIELLCGALPDIVYGQDSAAPLPTKNCLDYVLVRLLSAYHIQQRIHDCSVDVAQFFLEFIRANNFFDISTLLFAVLAKLRSLNASIGNKYIVLYSELLKYRNRFPTLVRGASFIPDTTKLPVQLDRFELPSWTSDENEIKTESIASTVVKSCSLPAIITANVPKIRKRVDMGTEIERKVEKKKDELKSQIDKIKTVKDLKSFIAKENEARKNSSSQSVTHRIPNHKWAGAQKIFERKLEAGETKKAMNVFLKFLSHTSKQL